MSYTWKMGATATSEAKRGRADEGQPSRDSCSGGGSRLPSRSPRTERADQGSSPPPFPLLDFACPRRILSIIDLSAHGASRPAAATQRGAGPRASEQTRTSKHTYQIASRLAPGQGGGEPGCPAGRPGEGSNPSQTTSPRPPKPPLPTPSHCPDPFSCRRTSYGRDSCSQLPPYEPSRPR